MALQDPYKILGLSFGAPEPEVKRAYRRLAMKYHPDLNTDPSAEGRFREIQEAYDQISAGKPAGNDPSAYSWDEVMDEIRRDRERMARQARARQAKKKKEDEFFSRGEWHDIILVARYLIHIFAILFGLAAVLFPLILAFFEPSSLVGTAYFIIIGGFLLFYIWKRRKTWLRLGRLNLKWTEVRTFFKKPEAHPASDHCCFTTGEQADGKAVRIELIHIQDIKVRSFGAMDHQASYKSKTRHVILPRSSRAQYWHRISTFVKLSLIISALVFLPFESILWRFLAGMAAGALLSFVLLSLARVKGKSGYLLTPGLLIKSILWMAVLLSISRFGPGFNVYMTSARYIVLAGMLFLLDMVFDLIMGLFPFYARLFMPLTRQGEVMTGLYREGYQNYQELPFYSLLYPFFRWLF
ncbi:MAG: J domain-containing protein [Bacteroidota bacterium]